VSWGHASEFLHGASWLGPGPPCPMLATYGGSQDLGEIPLPAYGSGDPHTNFFSLLAICFSAHGDI